MASGTICSSCLRAVRQQTHHASQEARGKNMAIFRAVNTRHHAQRSFTTARLLHASAKAPAPTRLSPPPPPPPPPPRTQQSASPPSSSAIANFAAQLRKSETLRSTTEPYIAYGGTEDLFLECSRQCSYTVPSALAEPGSAGGAAAAAGAGGAGTGAAGTAAEPPKTASGEELGEGSGWWLEGKARGGLGLPVTFNAWAQVLFLHMWLLTVRLRAFPAKYVRNWHQNLLDHFFYAAEDRMATWHRMSARSERNKYLKELWVQWRGALLSYDEGLIKGDAVLAAAVWRNVFKADPNVDINDLALVTGYVMKELQKLGRLDDETVAMGKIKFGDPRDALRSITGKDSEVTRSAPAAEKLSGSQGETASKVA